MPVAEFLDSNVVIYAYAADLAKRSRALDLLAGTPTISTQVLNETVAVLHRKRLMADDLVVTAIDDLAACCRVAQVSVVTIKRAVGLMNRYRFSYYDALIAASAIEAGCTVLYSEDMHHEQVIDDTLTIVNPFLAV